MRRTVAVSGAGPEAGGMTMREAQGLVRGLRGLDLIGADVVEVSPPLDPGENTALCGATILYELLCIVAEAHAARKLILASPDQSIAAIAAAHGRCRTRLGKLAALACLAPDIVTAIVEGRQSAALTARTLQEIDLPLGWPAQRALLGFA